MTTQKTLPSQRVERCISYTEEMKALAGATDVVADPPPESVAQRLRRVLADLKEPISVQRLRQLCGLRTATVCAALAELSEQGLVCQDLWLAKTPYISKRLGFLHISANR